MTWFDKLPGVLSMISIRYYLVAGVVFVLFYILLRKRIAHKKIQQRFPANKDYAREILYSTLTIVIFTLVAFTLLYTPLRHYTLFYLHADAYPAWWFYFAFPLMFLVHDTYFYWTHRLMHHKKLFPYFHRVHHLSTNPSPWASFAFHPLEAFVEAGIFPVLMFTMPLTSMHILVFFIVMMFYNVYGHLGWELYPRGFARNSFGKWINTSFNHNQHHQFFKGNYGLYFLWWDRWMGTIRGDYEEKFDTVAHRQ